MYIIIAHQTNTTTTMISHYTPYYDIISYIVTPAYLILLIKHSLLIRCTYIPFQYVLIACTSSMHIKLL